MDDTNWWVWLIIALVIIALIAVVASMMRNRAKARAVEHNRHKAGRLRDEAQVTSVEASRREADAAAARADAEEARVRSEQLEREAQQHEHHAGEAREQVDERLRAADAIDPDGGSEEVRTGDADSTTEGATSEHVRRDTPPA